MINIKTLKDGAKYIEISQSEYDSNYTDKVNFMYCFDQDTGKTGYYKRETILEIGVEWFLNNHERSVD